MGMARMMESADLDALNDEVVRLYQTGNYAAATPLAERALRITENRHGLRHSHVAASLNNLALLYQAQGRYAEAEPLLRRDLAITEEVFGPGDPDVGTSLN